VGVLAFVYTRKITLAVRCEVNVLQQPEAQHNGTDVTRHNILMYMHIRICIHAYVCMYMTAIEFKELLNGSFNCVHDKYGS
jgi:hypothetical protein